MHVRSPCMQQRTRNILLRSAVRLWWAARWAFTKQISVPQTWHEIATAPLFRPTPATPVATHDVLAPPSSVITSRRANTCTQRGRDALVSRCRDRTNGPTTGIPVVLYRSYRTWCRVPATGHPQPVSPFTRGQSAPSHAALRCHTRQVACPRPQALAQPEAQGGGVARTTSRIWPMLACFHTAYGASYDAADMLGAPALTAAATRSGHGTSAAPPGGTCKRVCPVTLPAMHLRVDLHKHDLLNQIHRTVTATDVFPALLDPSRRRQLA